MRSDEIRTSRRVVSVRYEERKELERRLEAAGHKDAAEDLRTRRTFAETRKQLVLDVLDARILGVGYEGVGPALGDLRSELDADMTGS